MAGLQPALIQDIGNYGNLATIAIKEEKNLKARI